MWGWGGSYCKVPAKCAQYIVISGAWQMELEKKDKCNVWSEVRGDNILKMGYLVSENFETYSIFIILKIIQIPI